MLEYFGVFSNLDATSLRNKSISIVKEDIEYWSYVGAVVTRMKFITFQEWLNYMVKPDSISNELMLFILCRVHYRHAVVYTTNRSWSTVKSTKPLSTEETHTLSDLHLVYVGDCMYGELRRLPMAPAPNRSVTPYQLFGKPSVGKIIKNTRGLKPLDLHTSKPNEQTKGPKPKRKTKPKSLTVKPKPKPKSKPRKNCTPKAIPVVHLTDSSENEEVNETSSLPTNSLRHSLPRCFTQSDIKGMSSEVSDLMRHILRSDSLSSCDMIDQQVSPANRTHTAMIPVMIFTVRTVTL